MASPLLCPQQGELCGEEVLGFDAGGLAMSYRGFCILLEFSAAASPISVLQAGAPGTGKTTFIQNLASAYGSQDEGTPLSS